VSFEWRLYARDQNLRIQGEVDEYTEAILTPVFNDVGTWQITVDRRSDMAVALTTPGWGIVAMRAGSSSPVFSGPIVTRHHTVSTTAQTIQIAGVSDDVWLKRRVVSPSPGESTPPYTVTASDALAGVASTVLRHYVDANAGPGAITPREVPGLTIAADPLIGANVSGDGRWDNLLAFLQPLAISGGVGFRIIQVSGGMQFQVFQGRDLTGSAKFATGLGTLAGFDYQTTAPTANYVYVGGAGTGTARTIKECPDSAAIATWGRIEGDLVNQQSTSDPTQLQQAGTDALTQGSEQTSLSITPLERPGLQFGVDYQLGDKVSVQIEGPGDGTIQDVLRSVEIHLTPAGPQTVTPSIGTARAADVFRMSRTFRVITSALKRINNLERG
jgi:hypothetical protein